MKLNKQFQVLLSPNFNDIKHFDKEKNDFFMFRLWRSADYIHYTAVKTSFLYFAVDKLLHFSENKQLHTE